MKWETHLFYDEAGVLSHAYRIFADKTREDLNSDELGLLREAIKKSQKCIS